MSKFETVEIARNEWQSDGTPTVNNRWTCGSETDALDHAHIRSVEATIQGRTDVHFEAREDGRPIDRAGWEVPEDDVVFQSLAEMGYTEEEILSALGC